MLRPTTHAKSLKCIFSRLLFSKLWTTWRNHVLCLFTSVSNFSLWLTQSNETFIDCVITIIVCSTVMHNSHFISYSVHMFISSSICVYLYIFFFISACKHFVFFIYSLFLTICTNRPTPGNKSDSDSTSTRISVTASLKLKDAQPSFQDDIHFNFT